MNEEYEIRLRTLIADPHRESKLAEPSAGPPLVLLGYITATSGADSALVKLEVLIQGNSTRDDSSSHRHVELSM
jgi:hypothetical protein